MITREDILDHLRAVVAEAGEDFVYEPPLDDVETCLYVRNGEYDCIAAHVFGRLGVPTNHLEVYEGKGAGMVAKWLDLDLTDDAKRLLELVQSNQDNGFAWGTALAMAEKGM